MKKAAVFNSSSREFSVKEYPVIQPEAGQAGLTLIASGICGTDVHIHGGFLGMPDMPLIIGHEFVGTVAALGSDAECCDALGTALQIGDKAIACVAIPCGKCFNCLAGETASCLNFGVTYCQNAENAPHFFGGFAEYLFSPVKNLVRLPESVDPLAAVAFPCGGPTVIRACEYGGGLKAGEIVVIQGNGSLGLFALAWAKQHGCKVVVIGSSSNSERLKFTEELQADLFLDYRTTSTADAVAQVKALAAEAGRGDGADVVIETSGAVDAFAQGLELLRTRGRYFVPGQYSNRGPVAIEPQKITFRALQIIGSGQYTIKDIETYLKFLDSNKELQAIFSRMVSTYCVGDVDQAMKDAHDGKTIKAAFAQN